MMKQQIASIQYLRAIAALMVVFHHARNVHPWLYNPLSGMELGQCGVDLFFVISGFVMYAAARQEQPAQFIRRRLARIVPLYWLAMLVTAPFIMLNHASALDGRFASHVLKSLLFIPHYSPEHPGQIWPLLVVGWSLSYELFFYAVFAVGLATRRLLPTLIVTLVPLVAFGRLFHFDNAIWVSFTDPLLLEFLAGVLLAAGRDRLARFDLAWLLPLGVIALAASPLVALPRAIVWGLPSLAIVAGAVSLEARGRLPRLKTLGALGDASYAIYLFQVLVIGFVGLAVQRLPVHGPPQFAVMVGLCLVGSACVGLAAHRLVERPLLRALLSRRWGPRAPTPLPAAVASA